MLRMMTTRNNSIPTLHLQQQQLQDILVESRTRVIKNFINQLSIDQLTCPQTMTLFLKTFPSRSTPVV